MAADPQAFRIQTNTYLAYALGFTPDELMLNRTGQMSDRQQAQFSAQYAAQSATARRLIGAVLLISVPVFAVVMLYLLGAFGGEPTLSTSDTPTLLLVILGVGGTLAVWALMMWFALRRMRRNQGKPQMLSTVTGTARIKQHHAPVGSAASMTMAVAGVDDLNLTLEIGRVMFVVNETAAKGFVPGPTYRVYYVGFGRAGMLVSAEVL